MYKQKKVLLNLSLLMAVALFSCEKEEDQPEEISTSSNASPVVVEKDCRLFTETLVDFLTVNSVGQEKVVEWEYKDGIRIAQRTNFPPNSEWLDSIQFRYNDGLLDTLRTYQKSNPNYIRLHVFRHDEQGRLTRIVRFDGGVRGGTELMEYTSETTGIYTQGTEEFKFYLDSVGNLIKMKRLNPSFAGQTLYYYFIYDQTKNPHYRLATYPLNFSQYISPNYNVAFFTYADSIFDHDSAVASRPIVSSIQSEFNGFPSEFQSDTSSSFYYKRVYEYLCE